MASNVIVTTKAIRTLRICAWWTLLAAFLMVVLLVFPSAYGRARLGTAAAISIVGLVGSETSLMLLVGMLSHLLTVGQCSSLAKFFWAAVMVCAIPVGAVVYFFAVYKKQIANISV